MYARRGDFLQFCFTCECSLDNDELKYCFVVCDKSINETGIGVQARIKKNKHTGKNIYITRDFERFNVICSEDTLERIRIPSDEIEDYQNRPESSLIIWEQENDEN